MPVFLLWIQGPYRARKKTNDAGSGPGSDPCANYWAQAPGLAHMDSPKN